MLKSDLDFSLSCAIYLHAHISLLTYISEAVDEKSICFNWDLFPDLA